jgi:nucleoside-diphosphate-sugar epimerase
MKLLMIAPEPFLEPRGTPISVQDNAYDIRKAKRDLGFQPQVELRAGPTQTRHWLQGELHA